MLAALGARFLRSVARFERRSADIRRAFVSAWACASAFLFAPLVIFGAVPSLVRVADGIKSAAEDEAARLVDSERRRLVDDAVGRLIAETGVLETAEVAEARERAVSFAAKMRGRTLADSIEGALSLMKVRVERVDADGEVRSSGERVIPESALADGRVQALAGDVFRPLSMRVRRNAVLSPRAAEIFGAAAERADFSGSVGSGADGIVPPSTSFPDGSFVRAFAGGLLAAAAAVAAVAAALSLWAALLLREDKGGSGGRERTRLFEFGEGVFEEISAMK